MNERSEDESGTDPSVDRMVISRDTVLAILGGEWPDSGTSEFWPSGFAWDSVDHFEVECGVLIPYAGGLPAPGPDFVLTMI